MIVEDGTGLPDANSYASVADAEAFHIARQTAAWINSSDDDAKAASLILATDYIDATYRFAGKPLKPVAGVDQPLSYLDRIAIDLVYDDDSSPVFYSSDDAVSAASPQALANPRAGQASLHPLVAKATMVLAAKYLAGTVDSSIADRDVLVDQKTAGPVEKSTTYRADRSTDPFPDVSGILAPLLAGGVGSSIGRFVK